MLETTEKTNTKILTWIPQLYMVEEIHDEQKAAELELCGLQVTKSNILAETWYAWVPVVEMV
jgi:hypothetical protein